MNIIDYFLIGGVAAAAIYRVYRLFLGWRNSANQIESDSRKFKGILVHHDGPVRLIPPVIPHEHSRVLTYRRAPHHRTRARPAVDTSPA
jgi:hypothetical protein